MERGGYTDRLGSPRAPKFDLLVNIGGKQYCFQLTPPVTGSYGQNRGNQISGPTCKDVGRFTRLRAREETAEFDRPDGGAEMERNSMLGISTGTETILLLENEPGMRLLVSQMLLLAGYTVREAADSAEAVRLIEEGGRLADLLLADMASSGEELPRRLTRKYANLRILLTSDHADDQSVLDVVASGVHVLPKPFSPGALMSKVRQVLDGPLAYAASRGAAAGGQYPAAG